MKNKKREHTECVIYTRFSPKPKSKLKPNETSCDTQARMCEDYCKFRGWRVLHAFKEKLVSGGAAERPQLDLAIGYAKRKRCVLVVYDLSRFSRGVVDALNRLEDLESGGAALASLREQLDTTTPQGRLVYTILCACNQAEREIRAQTTREHIRDRMMSGMHLLRNPPYGWRYEPGPPARLEANEYERAVLRIIKQLRDRGNGWIKTARALNRMRLKPRRCPRWTKYGVRKIVGKLEDGFYERVWDEIFGRNGDHASKQKGDSGNAGVQSPGETSRP